MGYSKENYAAVSELFRKKRIQSRENEANEAAVIRERLPEVAKIDAVLAGTGAQIMKAAMEFSGKEYERKLKKLESQCDELNGAREELLRHAGYPADYGRPRFECEKCNDTGIDSATGKVCGCYKRALSQAGLESSGIGKLVGTQSFDTFDLSFYTGDDRANAEIILSSAKNYAANFGTEKAHNILYIGKTGLGKTHLSSSVAKSIIERGFDVIYDSAQNIFSDFEKEKFSRYQTEEVPDTRRYLSCDLLIIDDLGTEMSTQFTLSCFYNILNTRIASGKSTMINTNLAPDALLRKYDDRIYSRLMGEFSAYVFRGNDVREQKLKKSGEKS